MNDSAASVFMEAADLIFAPVLPDQDVVAAGNDHIRDLDGFLEGLMGLFKIMTSGKHLALFHVFRSGDGIAGNEDGCSRL